MFMGLALAGALGFLARQYPRLFIDRICLLALALLMFAWCVVGAWTSGVEAAINAARPLIAAKDFSTAEKAMLALKVPVGWSALVFVGILLYLFVLFALAMHFEKTRSSAH